MQGDADWLKRLVLNLLDNAIKFTPHGGRVVVDVHVQDKMARLAVRDTGGGIDPEVKPHIFERFFRADPARSRGVEGVGLGTQPGEVDCRSASRPHRGRQPARTGIDVYRQPSARRHVTSHLLTISRAPSHTAH